MSTLTTNRQYLDGDDLTQAQLDDAFDSIETWGNGNIGTANIATSGVDTAQLAASSVTASKIASDAVTTAKILDGAVTGAKLDSGVVDNATLAYSSSQLKIKDAGVGSTQLAAASVTQAKRAALGQQVSSSSSTFSHSGDTNLTAVTNLSVSLTTTGRPVFVGLIPDGTNSAYIQHSNLNGAKITLYRDSTEIANSTASVNLGGTAQSMTIPVSSIYTIDVPGAATYTYTCKVQLIVNTTGISVYYAKLVAYEL